MYGWDGGWGIGGWIAMGLLMLIFWGGVITVVVLLIRRAGASGPHAPGPHAAGPYGAPHEEAERILNERFARGEIDETELTARRAALRRKD